YLYVVSVDVFVSFVTTILGAAPAAAAAAAEGGVVEGVTMVVGRTGDIPSRWGELLNFLMPPPLPPLPDVPPPSTTEGVFRRDNTEVAAIRISKVLDRPNPTTVHGEVLPDALLPGGEGDLDDRIESGDAARRPLSLN
ncbi:hypothetical protein PFISCL1PPCAC_20421, partial [Pristionchus fissidentatus]